LPITALLSPAAEGADLQVGTGQTYAAIQDAVDAAMPGDTILVHVGTYAESITTNTVASESARIVLGAAGDGDVLVQGAVTLDGDYCSPAARATASTVRASATKSRRATSTTSMRARATRIASSSTRARKIG
jgi:pectin methylesterase-like acyl-CoA thioesterase